MIPFKEIFRFIPLLYPPSISLDNPFKVQKNNDSEVLKYTISFNRKYSEAATDGHIEPQ